MSIDILLGPRAHGPVCGQAVFKATAEHFQVHEQLDIELSGQGEHLWLWVEKRELNTEAAARRLARAAQIPLRNVGYAGLKDRQAVCRQWFSLHLPGRPDPDLTAAQCGQLQVLRAVRHGRKLQRGAHTANHFVIRLTALQADRQCLEQRLDTIGSQGVPNYFGWQRFGHEGHNLSEARLLAGRGELPEARNLRSRLLSSARSYLFNRVLAERVQAATWNRVCEGDLLSFTDSRSFFTASSADRLDPRLERLDLHPTGPLWGRGGSPAAAGIQILEQALADHDPALTDWLETAALTQERRILRLPVRDLSWHYPAADTLQLTFTLPTGCFATAVIRELLDLVPAEQQMDIPCEF